MDINFSDESIEEAACREFKALQAEICRWDLFGAQVDRNVVNFHIISDWFNHNKTDRNVRKTVKIMAG